jgi:hypothetical protein
MRPRHNAQLANFDVTSLLVTSATTTQQDFQMMCDEATRRPVIAAHEEFLSGATSTPFCELSRVSERG